MGKVFTETLNDDGRPAEYIFLDLYTWESTCLLNANS